MTRSDEDRVIEQIRAAKPASLPSGKTWADSERAERLLERMLDAADAEAPGTGGDRYRRPAAWRWTPRRVGLAAAVALVLVALAVSLSLAFGWQGEEPGTVVQEPSTVATTPSTVPRQPQTTVASTKVTTPAAEVTKLSAVERLMPVFESVIGGDRPGSTELAGRLELAVAHGLITRDEIAAGAAASPLSQGQYAVLLWQAFADSLPKDIAPVGVVDPSASPAERLAIEGLERAGILRASDPPYAVDDLMTAELESRLLDRVDKAIHGLPSS